MSRSSRYPESWPVLVQHTFGYQPSSFLVHQYRKRVVMRCVSFAFEAPMTTPEAIADAGAGGRGEVGICYRDGHTSATFPLFLLHSSCRLRRVSSACP